MHQPPHSASMLPAPATDPFSPVRKAESQDVTTMRAVVTDAIEEAYNWIVEQDRRGTVRFVPLPCDTMSNPAWRRNVPDGGFLRSELASVDPRIADVLHHEYASAARPEQYRIDVGLDHYVAGLDHWRGCGFALRASCKLWNDEMVELPVCAFAIEGQVLRTQYIGEKDFHIDLSIIKDEEVLLLQYEPFAVDTTANQTHYIRSLGETTQLELSIGWMNLHYPHWRAALTMASSLDIKDSNTLRSLVFELGAPSLPSACVQGVEFD